MIAFLKIPILLCRRTRTHRLFSLLFSMFLLLPLAGCTIRPHTNGEAAADPDSALTFQEYTKKLFASEAASDTLSLHYSITNPSAYGISTGEATLGRFSSTLLRDSLLRTEQELTTLHSFSYETLSKKEQLTYDILEAALSLTLTGKGLELYHEQLGPTTGIQAQLPLLLAEYRFETETDVQTYLSLLPCVYTFFSDLIQYEKERSAAGLFMCDAVADEIIAQCEAFIAQPEENFLITYFNEKAETLSSLSDAVRTEYKLENTKQVFRSVIPAYELLIDTLTALKGTGRGEYGLCYAPLGREYYEYLVRKETGTSKTVSELAELLSSVLSEQLSLMQTILLESPSVYADYLTFRYPLEDPEASLAYLQDAILSDFPTPAQTTCEIKYVHSSLQDYVSPAMYFVPPIDCYTKNCIYINPNPSYDLSRIFSTLAHEGYPGHLYQHTYFLSTEPEPLRCLLNFSGYDEGWATYAESLSYDLAGLKRPLTTFLQANLLSTLCLYSLTDIQIHYEGRTKEDITATLAEYGFSAETAEEIFYTLLAEPGMYHPYTVGYLEILELKNLYQELCGAQYTDLAFHTFILNMGPAPFEILKKYMYHTDPM